MRSPSYATVADRDPDALVVNEQRNYPSAEDCETSKSTPAQRTQ